MKDIFGTSIDFTPKTRKHKLSSRNHLCQCLHCSPKIRESKYEYKLVDGKYSANVLEKFKTKFSAKKEDKKYL